MLEIIELIKKRNAELEVKLQELDSMDVDTYFQVGKFTDDVLGMNLESKIFFASIIHSRTNACKLLGDKDMIKESKETEDRFKKAIEYTKNMSETVDEISENTKLLYEAESLLTDDDKRKIFLEKAYKSLS